MELRSRMSKVALAVVAGLIAIAGSQAESEASEYKSLCGSVPAACDYAPPTAPTLNADACYDGAMVTLMTGASCDEGSWAFWVENGEVVDVMTNQIQGYIPLRNGCDMGFCVPNDPNGPPDEPAPMCCETGDGCNGNVQACGGIVVWCDGNVVDDPNNPGKVLCEEAA